MELEDEKVAGWILEDDATRPREELDTFSAGLRIRSCGLRIRSLLGSEALEASFARRGSARSLLGANEDPFEVFFFE